MAYLTSTVPPTVIYNEYALKIKWTENKVLWMHWIVMLKQCAPREQFRYQLESEMILVPQQRGAGPEI